MKYLEDELDGEKNLEVAEGSFACQIGQALRAVAEKDTS